MKMKSVRNFKESKKMESNKMASPQRVISYGLKRAIVALSFFSCLGALGRNSAGRAGATYRDGDAELRLHGGQCVQRDGYYRMSEAIQRIRFDGRREGAFVFYFSACRRKLSPNGSQT
jgi:hypothetical protein